MNINPPAWFQGNDRISVLEKESKEPVNGKADPLLTGFSRFVKRENPFMKIVFDTGWERMLLGNKTVVF